MSAHCVKPDQPHDIVERLRDPLTPIDAVLIKEAADEIERLRPFENGFNLLQKDYDSLWNAYNLKGTKYDRT